MTLATLPTNQHGSNNRSILLLCIGRLRLKDIILGFLMILFMMMIMTMIMMVEKALHKSSSVCYHHIRHRGDFVHDDHGDDDGGGKSII